MKITDVEAMYLRLPDVDASRCDGTQDTLVVLVHTDEGLTGVGEVDSAPLVAKAAIDAVASHSLATGLRSLLVGEDPSAIAPLWDRMYAGTSYFGRSGPAVHAMSGVDIALWDLHGKVTGRSVAASAHFAAATPSCSMIEYTASTSPLARDLVTSPLSFQDGRVRVPTDRPGLGVELNPEIVARYQVA